MRKRLEPFLGEKVDVEGILKEYSLKLDYVNCYIVTVLLKKVIVTNGEGKNVRLNHVWLITTPSFAKKNPCCGAKLSMKCTVRKYKKGHHENMFLIDKTVTDFGLDEPSKLKVVEEGDGEDFKTFYQRMSEHYFIKRIYKPFV